MPLVAYYFGEGSAMDKTYRGGVESLRKRGLKSVLVPLRPEERVEIKVAAARADLSASAFLRAAILHLLRSGQLEPHAIQLLAAELRAKD